MFTLEDIDINRDKEFYFECSTNTGKEIHFQGGKRGQPGKSLYLKECDEEIDSSFFEKGIAHFLISELVVGQDAKCIRRVYQQLGTNEKLINLSYLSVDRLIEVLRQLPSNISSLVIDSWDHGLTIQKKEMINDELRRFTNLKYLGMKIEGGNPEFFSWMENLQCLNAKIGGVDSQRMADIFRGDAGRKIEQIKLHWQNTDSAADWLKLLHGLKSIELTQHESVLELSEIAGLEKLERLHAYEIGKTLPPARSWPKMQELIAWKSDVSKQDRFDFHQKSGEGTTIVLDNDDKIDYLFGNAQKIVFRKSLRGNAESSLIKVVSERVSLDKLHIILDVKPGLEDLSLMCLGDVAAHIRTESGNEEVVYIFNYGSVLKWKNWGDLSLTESSQKRLKSWMNELGIVSDGAC